MIQKKWQVIVLNNLIKILTGMDMDMAQNLEILRFHPYFKPFTKFQGIIE